MRKLYLILALMSAAIWAPAQCIISGNGGGGGNELTQDEIIDCLMNAGCNSSTSTSGCTVTITGSVDIKSSIDLTEYEGLTFTIASGGVMTFFNNGSLALDPTSTLIVENDGTLDFNGNATQAYITFVSPITDPPIIATYTGAQFEAIIAAGGVDVNGLLPIELIAFSGKAEGGRILLHWTTASEQNNDYMAIEHSLDGRSFREIGRVEGAGNSQSLRYYELAHQHPFNGDNYYRIRQVDFDGAVAYHSVIAIYFSGKHRKVSIYPNPADDVLNLRIANEEAANVQLQFYDRTGKLVRQQSLQAGQQAISTAGLQTGFYYIRITSGSITEVIPFEKL